MTRQNRREFMKTGAVATAGFLVASGNSIRPARASALQSVAVASIGVGGSKGWDDVNKTAHYGKIVAFCDLDSRSRERAGKRFPDAKQYIDYRDLFAEYADKFDAVTITIPDHMHTVVTMAALHAKKHCLTQKPLTRTVYESRRLAEEAVKAGVCTQMSNQGSSFDSLRRIIPQVKRGLIGAVQEIHVWSDRPIWPQGPNRDMTIEKFAAQIKKTDPEIAQDEIADKQRQIDAVLKRIDWKLWLGVAPKRGFWPGIYHSDSYAWRGWFDFGGGAIGSMSTHLCNMVYRACELTNPVSVQAETTGHDFNSYPKTSKVRYDFAANDWRGAIPMFWSDSRIAPTELLEKYGIGKVEGIPACPRGSLLIGEKGAIYSPNDYCAEFFVLEPGGKRIPEFKDVEFRAAPRDQHSGDFDKRHQLEWYTAIWENKPELCYSAFPTFGGPFNEITIVGNLAIYAAFKPGLGPKVLWDHKKMEITNLKDFEAPGIESLLRPKYTEGYEQV